VLGCYPSVSLNFRLKDLLGPVTRVKKKKKKLLPVREEHIADPWRDEHIEETEGALGARGVMRSRKRGW